MGGLTVQGVTAAAISIVGNSVGTLFVGNSGPPIEISDNHAVRADVLEQQGSDRFRQQSQRAEHQHLPQVS
jgi:hypothetical protein